MRVIVIDPQKKYEADLARAEENRRIAYSAESDPLFFKEQRGELAIGTWQAKVDEIKARYPKPEKPG